MTAVSTLKDVHFSMFTVEWLMALLMSKNGLIINTKLDFTQ